MLDGVKRIDVKRIDAGPTDAGFPRGVRGGPDLLRTVFRSHPAGVAVVTVDSGGRPIGFTATSVVSVSADPPMVSFSIADSASSWPHLEVAETAVVHFLHSAQTELARTFATSGIDRFAPPTRWSRLSTGEPLLDDTAAWLRLRLEEPKRAGQAWLLLGLVLEGGTQDRPDPLLYHGGRFLRLSSDSRDASASGEQE